MKIKVNQVLRHVRIYILKQTLSQPFQPAFPTDIYPKFEAFSDYENQSQTSQPRFATCTYLDFEANHKSTWSTSFSDTHILKILGLLLI